MEKLKARIEAVLFTTGKALQTSEIAEILETDKVLKDSINDLRMIIKRR